jgi:hypothetical protein
MQSKFHMHLSRRCGARFDVCNGNRVNDARRCSNMDCRVRPMCDRVVFAQGCRYLANNWLE